MCNSRGPRAKSQEPKANSQRPKANGKPVRAYARTLVKHRDRFLLRLAGQLLDKTSQPLLGIFLGVAIECDAHADTRMRAHRAPGQVNFLVIGLDGQRDHLPCRQRRKSKDVTAAQRNIAHGAPVTRLALFRMNAHAGIAYVTRKFALFLIFSRHTTTPSHTRTWLGPIHRPFWP